jgi:hypothetical protein
LANESHLTPNSTLISLHRDWLPEPPPETAKGAGWLGLEKGEATSTRGGCQCGAQGGSPTIYCRSHHIGSGYIVPCLDVAQVWSNDVSLIQRQQEARVIRILTKGKPPAQEGHQQGQPGHLQGANHGRMYAPRGGDPPEGGTGAGLVQQSESHGLSSNGTRWLVFLSFSHLLLVLEREVFALG